MTVKQFVIENGKKGASGDEKYVDISPITTIIKVEEGTPFVRRKKVSIVQVCYFGFTNGIEVYCIDNYNDGWFYEWDKLSKAARYKVINALLQFD